jgi:SAM-dependent methyltransferase
MYFGFPTTQIHLLSCPKDNGKLSAVKGKCDIKNERIVSGALKCIVCDCEYQVNDGIVCLLENISMDQESAHEKKLRDQLTINYRRKRFLKPGKNNEMDMMEILPTLAALKLAPNQNVLELGCGTGKYTIHLAKNCRALIAVDFSLESLKVLVQKLQPKLPVGLVHADITNFAIAPRLFHRVLSTLVSNLPSREHRLSMYHIASNSLEKNGHFVFSTHYYGIRERYMRLAKSGRYTKGGIYRYYFRRNEVKRETKPYFNKIYSRPIQIVAPFNQRRPMQIIVTLLKKIGFNKTILFSRIAEHFPLINEFGKLLLVVVKEPIYPPEIEEGNYNY